MSICVCVLVFCVCMSDCVSKSVCARVFAFMSVYLRLYVFFSVCLDVPMCFLCIDVSACDSRVFVHIYVCDVDVGGHSCDCFFSILSLCEFVSVYVHTCM